MAHDRDSAFMTVGAMRTVRQIAEEFPPTQSTEARQQWVEACKLMRSAINREWEALEQQASESGNQQKEGS